MTTVIHHRLRQPIDEQTGTYVYIGRPSKWGNPFVIGRHGSREEVILKFEEYWHSDGGAMLRVAAIQELTDKVLGCWCKPERCHGDIIAGYVNEYGR